MINYSIRYGIFPNCLKKSKIVPVHKKGNVDDYNNYRPIAIIPVLSKIFEQVLNKQLTDFLVNNNILFTSQFGFIAKKSTSMAINELVSFISDGFENKEYVGITFCDLSKAFDCVDHSLLVSKLRNIGIANSSVTLLSNYLSKRCQTTLYNSHLSQCQITTYGVPQGSILGPLLFIVYINNLPAAVDDVNLILYADDTTLSTANRRLATVTGKLAAAQSNAQNWFHRNGLYLNKDKTSTMIFSTRYIGIDNPNHTKFLGITLDTTLCWEAHVDVLSKKLAKTIYLLRKLSSIVSLNIKKLVYFSLFQSHFAYALATWGHTTHLPRIFKLQRKAIRIISNVNYREDVRQYYVEHGILTVPSLYVYQCLVNVKTRIESYTKNRDHHCYNTRQGDDICLDFRRINKSRNSINYYGPQFYNCLPDNIASLPMPQFLIKIKTLLLKSPLYDTDIRSIKSVFNK